MDRREYNSVKERLKHLRDVPEPLSAEAVGLFANQVLKVFEKQPRIFPIQKGSPIPWYIAERAYATYVQFYGTDQSMERLAERGGFGLQEFACLFCGHKPVKDHVECVEKSDAVGRKIASLEKAVDDLQHDLESRLDPTLDMINANRDSILRIYEKGLRKIQKELCGRNFDDPRNELWTRMDHIEKILHAINSFHPMHEDWIGWPE